MVKTKRKAERRATGKSPHPQAGKAALPQIGNCRTDAAQARPAGALRGGGRRCSPQEARRAASPTRWWRHLKTTRPGIWHPGRPRSAAPAPERQNAICRAINPHRQRVSCRPEQLFCLGWLFREPTASLIQEHCQHQDGHRDQGRHHHGPMRFHL